jgi:hypothetical protein
LCVPDQHKGPFAGVCDDVREEARIRRRRVLNARDHVADPVGIVENEKHDTISRKLRSVGTTPARWGRMSYRNEGDEKAMI